MEFKLADTFDVIICGAGSGGGFLAGEIAAHGSVLILDAGPYVRGPMIPGYGAMQRRKFSTQINLGTYIPDGVNSVNHGTDAFQYPLYSDESNPTSSRITREARVVGGGSYINAGAWIHPRRVDWDGFAEATGVVGWTRETFAKHFHKVEGILSVRRDPRAKWNAASILYEQTALSMGIPVYGTATNRGDDCLYCGHNNAGMPCKYDVLMSTAITQIPKALGAGAQLVDNATVVRVEISNHKATGVTYVKDGQTVTANARKLVVVSAGAIGTPLILFSSDVHLVNSNVGKYLRAHPGVAVDAIIPGRDWVSDRGYQWNCYHYGTDANGQPMDTLVYASAAFPNTTWLAAQIGTFGQEYKDLMRLGPQRFGNWIFITKPNIYGRVVGRVESPIILYPMITVDGVPERKLFADVAAAVRQCGSILGRMGAVYIEPDPRWPDDVLAQQLGFRLPADGIFHPQGTCRAGSDPKTSVVDSNLMSHDIQNLMCCDASVIPNHISANTNAITIAIANRASDFVNSQILDRGSSTTTLTHEVAEQ